MRDPNTGFLFNLQPLASGKGYTATGIGKKFLVRILTVHLLLMDAVVAFFQSCLVSKWSFDSVLLRNLSWQGSTVVEGRNGR